MRKDSLTGVQLESSAWGGTHNCHPCHANLKSAGQDHLANEDVILSTKVTEMEASDIINEAIPTGVYGYLNHISTPVHSHCLIR